MKITRAYLAQRAKLKLLDWQPYIIALAGNQEQPFLSPLFQAQIDPAQLADLSRYRELEQILTQITSFGAPNQGPEKNLDWQTLSQTIFHSPRSVLTQKILLIDTSWLSPTEAQFLAKTIEPDAVLWTQASVKTKEALEVASKVAQQAQDLILLDADRAMIGQTLSRLVLPRSTRVISLSKKDYFVQKRHPRQNQYLLSYQTAPPLTAFHFKSGDIELPGIWSESSWLEIALVAKMIEILGIKLMPNFAKLDLLPGQGKITRGAQQQIILDVSYISVLNGLHLWGTAFDKWAGRKKTKWLIVDGRSNHFTRGKDPLCSKTLDQLITFVFESATISRTLIVSNQADIFEQFKKRGISRVNVVANYLQAQSYLKDNSYGEEAFLFLSGQKEAEKVIASLEAKENEPK